MLDRYIGDLMAKLTELEIADNTMVVFTSDNGPDRGGFYFLNKMGHLRMGTLRGKHKRYYIHRWYSQGQKTFPKKFGPKWSFWR